MKLFAISFLLLLTGYNGHTQSLKKYAIGTSGCSAYFFCDPGTIDVAKSQDSSDVYTCECENDDMHYGTICVKLKDRITDLDNSEQVLIAYLDYLKKTVNITKSAGYGKGHHLKNNEKTRGVIDYWEDKDKASWKVTGWTDGKYIVCLYGYSLKTLNETKANVFMNSLVLPSL
ncbi:MAG: hypothetical protein JWQ38_1145 [Flavipsychrobacter sp.]|nr:hypothetical protein [Flavipsychrobacter sp.]